MKSIQPNIGNRLLMGEMINMHDDPNSAIYCYETPTTNQESAPSQDERFFGKFILINI